MKKPPGRRIPIEKIATPAEVMAAIESLSAEQRYRLKTFSRFRVRGLGRAARGRTHEALLHEAVVSTLKGAEGGDHGRRWNKTEVRFDKHLLGAMRSISTHWLEDYERREGEREWLDCEMAVEDEEGVVNRPTENLIDDSSDPFRTYAAKELLETLDTYFDGDQDAQLVLMARKEGLSVSEMIADLGLTRERANAALQRIRYFAKGML